MAYSSWSVVFGEQPSAAKWNILGTNDASFNDGTGFNNEIILSKHLAPTVIQKIGSGTQSFNTSTNLTGLLAVFTPPIDCVAKVSASVTIGSGTVLGDLFAVNLDVDGVGESVQIQHQVPSGAGIYTLSQNWLISLTAAEHTLRLRGSRISGTGTIFTYGTDSSLIIELVGDANATLS